MKNKSLVFNLSFTTGLALIIGVLCIFNVFEKLDFRLYDGLLHFTKEASVKTYGGLFHIQLSS